MTRRSPRSASPPPASAACRKARPSWRSDGSPRPRPVFGLRGQQPSPLPPAMRKNTFTPTEKFGLQTSADAVRSTACSRDPCGSSQPVVPTTDVHAQRRQRFDVCHRRGRDGELDGDVDASEILRGDALRSSALLNRPASARPRTRTRARAARSSAPSCRSRRSRVLMRLADHYLEDSGSSFAKNSSCSASDGLRPVCFRRPRR